MKPIVAYDEVSFVNYKDDSEIAFLRGVTGHPKLPDSRTVRTSRVINKIFNPNDETDLIGFETLNTVYMEARYAVQ